MALHCYTTKIDPHKTIGEITGMLVGHGASAITVEHQQPSGRPIALFFTIQIRGEPQQFRLPVRADAVYDVLRVQKDSGKLRSSIPLTRQHADRVAWRIIRDWVEAQLAVIDTDQATLDEVMLPYAVLGDAGETLYQLVSERGMPRAIHAGPAPILLPAARERA